MIGTIGVAPATSGPTPLLVPTMAGGNMDISQLVAGSTLHLPAQVPGGLLSAGDTHAAQGDGEVCGTGAETSSTIRLRVERRVGREILRSLVRTFGAASRDGLDLHHRDRSRSVPGSP